MSRFFEPDDKASFAYTTSSQISQAKPGDFLKCKGCKRYQKIEQPLSIRPNVKACTFVCKKCKQAVQSAS